MAIIPLDPGNLDVFEIVGRPAQKFISGSHIAPTGSMPLVNNKSKAIKDIDVRAQFGAGPVVDNSYRATLEGSKLDRYATFKLTIGSGSYSSEYQPTRIVLGTGGLLSTDGLNIFGFRLLASASQATGSAGRTIDIKDLVALTPEQFTTQGGLKKVARRIQAGINDYLLTKQKDDKTKFTQIRHFIASNPVEKDDAFEMTVQYIRTPTYTGGAPSYRNKVLYGSTSNILIGPDRIATGSNLTTKLSNLLEETKEQPVTAQQGKSLRVTRFEPSLKFTKDTMRKNVVKDVLYPSYRHLNPNLHWAYTNYHCMNFFTGSGIPDDSAILYLNKLKPKFSVEIPALKNDQLDTAEFSKNSDSGFVNPQDAFNVDGVTSANKVLVLDSSQADGAWSGADFGRNITLKRKIEAGTMTTVKFDAIKSIGPIDGAAGPKSTGIIELKSGLAMNAFNGVKITLIDNEGSPTTKTYVLDRFGDYSVSGVEVKVDISASTTIQEALTVLTASIKSAGGHNGKIVPSVPESTSVVLTQATPGSAGNKIISVAGDVNGGTIVSSFAGGSANDGVQTSSSANLDPPEASAAASAVITIANNNANINGVQITLRSTDTTAKVYAFDTGQTRSGYLNGSDHVVVGVSNGSGGIATVNAIASNFQKAILSSAGHNGKIKVSVADAELTLTQKIKGSTGNQNISEANDSGNNITTPAQFTNGFTGEDIVILHRFANLADSPANWSELYRLDTATEKTANLNEWSKVNFDVTGDYIVSDYYLKIAQSPPSGDAEDHHILHNVSFTLDKIFDKSEVKLPYPYSPREDFTMSFWIKPKIVDKDKDGGYRAGTVLHLSSSYAVSLISGSSVDGLGRANKFRMMFQFDSSTDISPSNIPLVKPTRTGTGAGGNTPPVPIRTFWENDAQRPDPDPWVDGSPFKNGEYPKDGRIITNALEWENNADLIFMSSDNSLMGDHWHHVAVRWSANQNHRTGSIFVDGVLDSSFKINSGSAMPRSMPDSRGDPSVLFIGNYFDGINDGDGGMLQSQFFNGNASHQEGIPCAYKSIVDGDQAASLSIKIANTNIGMPASAANVLNAANAANTDTITINVPTTIGGSSTPVTITFANSLPSAANNAIGINVNGRSSADKKAQIIGAINGAQVQHSSTDTIRFAGAEGGQAGTGVPGITASAGSGNTVTLTVDTRGKIGNEVRVTEGNLDGIIVASALSNGYLQGGDHALITLETSKSIIRTFVFDWTSLASKSGQADQDGQVIVGISGASNTSQIATRLNTALQSSWLGEANENFGIERAGATLRLLQPDLGPSGNTGVLKLNDGNSSITVGGIFAGGFTAIPNYQIDNFLYRDPNDGLYDLSHPLKAEVHEVKIYDNFRTQKRISRDMESQVKLPDVGLIFYLPVHFVAESPIRDVMQTPFQTHRSKTNDPFNAALSFGVGGKTMNLPNFLREHIQKTYPRLLNLTASAITSTDTQARSADEWLGSISAHRKGNYTILPCDNGLFRPTYSALMTGSASKIAIEGEPNYVYRDDNGVINYGIISLRDMVSASLPMNPGHLLQDPSPIITPGMTDSEILNAQSVREKNIFAQIEGATPEDPGIAPGNILTVYNRTRDPDSNEVVFFDISNMFYGNRINPETVSIKDVGLSGTYGAVSLTLKDDGRGNIYREDCVSKPATWNNIGDIVYDEGIITLKNPILSHFGRKQFEIEFRGEQKVPVMEVTIPCPRNTMNSSSNPNYLPLKPSNKASENATDFIYITGVHLHDENFNIIGKATFAQPIVKRKTDTFLVKMKMDF